MASTIKEVVTLLSTPPPGARAGSGPGTILGTALACGAVFAFLQATGAALPKGRGRRLAKAGDALEWNLRVVSTLHAVLLTVGALKFLEEMREQKTAGVGRERGASTLSTRVASSSSRSAPPRRSLLFG
jgi:hypothetical protein